MIKTTFTDDNGFTKWEIEHKDFEPTGTIKVQGPHGRFSIPAEVMIAYAVEAVRKQRIRELQEARGPAVLGLEL